MVHIRECDHMLDHYVMTLEHIDEVQKIGFNNIEHQRRI